MLTFEQFQATRREVSDLADVIDDASLEGVPGFVYCNALYIEKKHDNWSETAKAADYLLVLDRLLVLGRDSRDLTKLERLLYEFACAEGYCNEPATTAEAKGGKP